MQDRTATSTLPRELPRSPRSGPPRSARRPPASARPSARALSAASSALQPPRPARGVVDDVERLDACERRQRRAEDRQAGGQVLVDLHREDAAGEVVDLVGDQARVGSPQDGRQVAPAARADQVDVRAPLAAARGRRPDPRRPLGPTRTMLQPGRSAATLRQQREVELGRRRPRPGRRAGGGAAPSTAGSTGPGSSAVEKQLRVGDVRRVEDVVARGAASARPGPGRWRARGRRARAKRSSAARKLSASTPFCAATSSTQW